MINPYTMCIKRSMTVLIILLGMLVVITAEAKTMSAKCSGFEGDTTGYYTSYPDKDYDLNKFVTAKDRLLDGNLTIEWNESEKKAQVRYVFRSNNLPDDEHEFHLIDRDILAPEKVTFVGYMQGGPTMISIYPELGIAIYTQHGAYHFSSLNGMSALMFHAKCVINFE